MQESASLSLIPHPAWSSPTLPSGDANGRGGVMKSVVSCNQSNFVLGKSSTMTNGVQEGYNIQESPTCASTPDPTPSSTSTTASTLTSTTKSAIHKPVPRNKLNNIQSWLSPHRTKGNDRNSSYSSTSSSSSNYYHHHQTSGYDMKKLYPELSAKLGLIKPSGDSNSSSKSCDSSSIKNGLISRDNKPSNDQSHSSSKSTLNNKHNSDGYLLNQKVFNNKFLKCKVKPSLPEKKPLLNSVLDDWKVHNHDHNDNAVLDVKVSAVGIGIGSDVSNDSSSSSPKTATQSFPGKSLNHFPFKESCQQSSALVLTPRKPLPSFPKEVESKLPPQIRHLQSSYRQYYAYNADLFSSGFDESENDSSDAEDCWWSSLESPYMHETFSDAYSFDDNSQSEQSYTSQNKIHSYRRQLISSCLRICGEERQVRQKWTLTRALLEAARVNPSLTAATLAHFKHNSHTVNQPSKTNSRSKSSLSHSRRCVYNCDQGECGRKALPGTRHCMRHITYNVDQQLFSQCSARLDDNTICRIPVCNVASHRPHCFKHASLQIGNNAENTASPENVQKPKRPRKKNKMPILSRYGKRSKRRRSSASTNSSSIIPSTSVRPPMASQTSSTLASPNSISPTSPHFSTPSAPAGVEESELEEEMEGFVGGLALEATRLLDPHDLQDVLNRIPEHELSQLFDDPDGKAEEFSETKEIKYENETKDETSNNNSSEVSTTHLVVNNPIEPPKRQDTKHPPDGDQLETALCELAASNVPIDSIISSSFNQQELNTISQVLSNIVQDENLAMPHFQIPGHCYSKDGTASSILQLREALSEEVVTTESSNNKTNNCYLNNEHTEVKTETEALTTPSL